MSDTDAAFVGTIDSGVNRLWYHDGAGVRQEVPHVVRDSPGGLSWGFAGKGPGDAALSILTAETGDAVRAEPYRKAFTEEVVAKLPLNDRFALPRAEVRAWLAAKGYEHTASERRREPAGTASDDGSPQVADLVQEALLAQRGQALDQRERRVTEREARVDALAVAVGLVPEVPTSAWLPAEPVRRQLAALVVDSGDDVAEVARAHHLDPEWAEAVADGRLTRVDLAHVRQACEGLRCTPYDLWGTDGARSVAHAYGPAEWPAHTEALMPVEGVEVSPVPVASEVTGLAAPSTAEHVSGPELARDLVPELGP